MNIDLWPLVAYTIVVVVLIIGLLGVSALLGTKRKDHNTHTVYESGMNSVGSANLRISVPYYLTAILFIIFDLEAVFLFAWAISIREGGWLGFIEVSIFIFILLAGLVYLWKAGALEWRTQRQQDDLKNVKGPGGVVNINRDGSKPESKEGLSEHDSHAGASH